MIVPKYFEDFDHLHVNTMPNRAYYIPASRRMEDLVENREASDRFFLLSGDWKFRYFYQCLRCKRGVFRRRIRHFCIRDDSGAVRLAELWP